MTHTILVTAPRLAKAGVDRLNAAGCTTLFLRDANDPTEVERWLRTHPVDAVISRTVTLSGEAIRACPTLKVISKHGVGVSNIDVAAASACGIPVYVTPGANAQSVAEMSLGLMLAAARRIGWMDAELRAGRWTRAQDGVELAGRTLGLVGFGQIALRVAHAAMAIGMKVAAYDPAIPGARTLDGVAIVPDLDTLLSRADVLSLHVPLTATTRGMIGRRELALLPADAILVNTARGEVVDEAALIEALSTRKLFAAGLDTTASEPIEADNPLLALPNVVLTPHVGGSTPAALASMASGAVQNVLGFLSGHLPDARTCVNPETLRSEILCHSEASAQ
ncbi:hydroxyacid dehydrogenase [Pandoraea sp. ISTKB]|uniref:hydroxyacid dehydrogenase n=1 Tax=Pandoraea sp. ISTKB TaxID=1586708 RepID=UPI0008473007|nr:hydroxyacid dehydrogenase [Pandoraea sp. ISTKB]ODP34769.1 hydroxyacid dehydrogenase [Pandoraea sp. ISTKB]